MQIRKSIAALAATLIVAASGVIGGAAVQQYAGAADYVGGYDFFPQNPTPTRVFNGYLGAGSHTVALGTTGDAHLTDALSLNITVSTTAAAGFLAAWGNGAYAGTSNVNWIGAGDVSSGFCTCPVWNTGSTLYMQVYLSSGATVSIDRFGKFQF